jgi:hypothetical protein
MMKIAVVALVVAGTATRVAGQERGPDSLYVSAHLDSGASLSGMGAEAGWLHTFAPHSALLVGGATATIDELSWAYLTVGGVIRHRRAILSGRTSVGTGQYAHKRSAYLRVGGTASIPLTRHLHAETEAQHAKVVGTNTTIVRFGGTYAGTRVSLRLTYNLIDAPPQSPYGLISGRTDVNLVRATVFGGLTAGRTRSLHPPAPELLTGAPTEFFGGAAFDIGVSRMTWAVQMVSHRAGSFSRVTAAWQRPVGGGTKELR